MSKNNQIRSQNKKSSRKTPNYVQEEIEDMEDRRKKETEKNILNSIQIRIKCKTENQKKFIKLIKDNEIIICSGNAGTGKAQPIDSIIITPDGYKIMGEIKIDDLVIGPDGNSTKVIGVFPQGKKEILEITFNDDSKAQCCKEHLWYTFSEHERNKLKKGSVRTTETLISDFITKGGRKKYSIPITKPVNFEYKNTYLHPYILGVLLSDGSLTKRITLSSIDEEIIDKIENLLPISLSINKINSSKCDFSITKKNRVRTGENEALNYLKGIKLHGLKSDKNFIPREYLFNSIENRIELLRGLMDTDGYVSKDGTNVEFYTTSNELSEDIKFLVQSLGGIIFSRIKQTKFKYKNEIKVGKPCNVLTICMPADINPFYISRKSDRVLPKTKYKPIRLITNIKSIGYKEAQCIMIENHSGLYLTNEFIVTHNTFLAVSEALNLLKEEETVYKKIILIKSVTPLKGEEVGFLKGDLDTKLAPFMYSFMANFYKLIGNNLSNSLKEQGIIEILPIAFIRGLSIDNSIIIIDEAQNISIDNMESILTRIGENSKMIIIGDTKQIDIKNKRESSLNLISEKFSNIEGFGIMKFEKSDQVRNPLINKIEDVFDKLKEKNNPLSNRA